LIERASTWIRAGLEGARFAIGVASVTDALEILGRHHLHPAGTSVMVVCRRVD